jgi:hypothetical protein
MTIDELLDGLTERHESRTQSVELLARTGHEHSQPIPDIMEASARLLHIAQIYESRSVKNVGRVWKAAKSEVCEPEFQNYG